MIGPLLAAVLVGLAVLTLFLAIQRLAPQRDPMEERLREYGLTEYVKGGKRKDKDQPAHKGRFGMLDRLVSGFGMGEKLGKSLLRADIPLTVGEFSFLMMALGAIGFLLGTLRANAIIGFVLGAVLAFSPLLYLKFQQGRRSGKFTSQLPDILTLLVGSMRAGYGLAQAIDLIAREVPEPASKEFGRVVRAMSLGLPMQRALEALADRIQSDDLDLVVTAINVQYEMGGNLASVLETISDTIRQRVQVLREVQALTAQQRMTGMILALLPILLAMAMAVMQPGYFDPFFEPGWPRLLPIAALVMIGIGFFLIQKIVDIKV